MSDNIVSQLASQVKSAPYQLNKTDRADILTLADHALEQFNRHWAAWIATGDNTAYRLAMAARADRAALLEQMSNV